MSLVGWSCFGHISEAIDACDIQHALNIIYTLKKIKHEKQLFRELVMYACCRAIDKNLGLWGCLLLRSTYPKKFDSYTEQKLVQYYKSCLLSDYFTDRHSRISNKTNKIKQRSP